MFNAPIYCYTNFYRHVLPLIQTSTFVMCTWSHSERVWPTCLSPYVGSWCAQQFGRRSNRLWWTASRGAYDHRFVFIKAFSVWWTAPGSRAPSIGARWHWPTTSITLSEPWRSVGSNPPIDEKLTAINSWWTASPIVLSIVLAVNSVEQVSISESRRGDNGVHAVHLSVVVYRRYSLRRYVTCNRRVLLLQIIKSRFVMYEKQCEFVACSLSAKR